MKNKRVIEQVKDLIRTPYSFPGGYPKFLVMTNSELLDALISAVETIEWMNGCSSPARDEVDAAIEEGQAVIAKYQGKDNDQPPIRNLACHLEIYTKANR